MKRPTDYTHPEPPDDIPEKIRQGPSPLMSMAQDKLFRLPWPSKPVGMKKARSMTRRSGRRGAKKRAASH